MFLVLGGFSMSCLRDKFDHVLLDGRFETIAPLNHGSFGMVFMARDHVTDDLVAIKCLTKRSAPNEAGLTFAIDDKSEELALHRRLGYHPSIVSLVRSFETDAHIYLVLEFCSRGDLYEAIRNGQGPLETERVRLLMLELVDAVAFCHFKGVYHRDIKPENIFLTQSGTMKLGDFGLATTEKWTMETTVGSDRYMSPEQYDSAGAGYSPAQADIWAIGICLLNILFSRNPFTTPTEADPLFLDFSRDKQSLFDVFPRMSQDTYEVIVQCMNLDPRKRSLVGARSALQRVVSFTTLDEALDDFYSNDRKIGASSNREPLRTPSLQAPQADKGAFPWLKIMQDTPPRPIRRLNTIPDNESYTEDLFPKSEESSADWFSGDVQSPSMSSHLESRMGASLRSISASRPIYAPKRSMSRATRAVPAAGSLPITMSKPRAVPSLAALSGWKQPFFSKSWSDMWEEDEEEEERLRKLEVFRELNSRTWSNESRCQGVSAVQCMVGTDSMSSDMDELVEAGFFLHDSRHLKSAPLTTIAARYSPPHRSSNDKWTALGERRRAYAGGSDPEKCRDSNTRRHFAFASNPSSRGSWDGFSTHLYQKPPKDRPRDRPSFTKARDWNWRKDKRIDSGDVEWVGGWQEAHS